MSMSRVLITGGAGFIGTHLAERLCGQLEVVLFDNFHRDSLAFAPHLRAQPGVTITSGDVLDRAAISEAITGADTVVHLAAIAGVSSYYAMPLRTLQVNVLGTVNVLEEAVAHGVKRFIDCSTSEVYGPDALWVDEESPHGIGPVSDNRWVYASSKLAGEQFTLRYSQEHGMCGTVIRPFNVYGPRQTGEGAISNFCRAVASGEPMTVYGEGTAIRAWCYVSDLIEAMVAALNTPEAAGQVFNVGNPTEAESTLGLARRIARLEPQAEIRFEAVARSDVRARIPRIDKARAMLAYEPKVDLDEGLRRTLDWFKKQKVHGNEQGVHGDEGCRDRRRQDGPAVGVPVR